MSERPTPGLRVEQMTVRGPGLDAERGRVLAQSVARVLATRLRTPGTAIGRLSVRLPASALAADGTVDPAALAAALTAPGARHG
jgi:hypothetical protein